MTILETTKMLEAQGRIQLVLLNSKSEKWKKIRRAVSWTDDYGSQELQVSFAVGDESFKSNRRHRTTGKQGMLGAEEIFFLWA